MARSVAAAVPSAGALVAATATAATAPPDGIRGRDICLAAGSPKCSPPRTHPSFLSPWASCLSPPPLPPLAGCCRCGCREELDLKPLSPQGICLPPPFFHLTLPPSFPSPDATAAEAARSSF